MDFERGIKAGFFAGITVGIISGIIGTVSVVSSGFVNIQEAFLFESIIRLVSNFLSSMIFGIINGVFIAVLFVYFYNKIPGKKNITKALFITFTFVAMRFIISEGFVMFAGFSNLLALVPYFALDIAIQGLLIGYFWDNPVKLKKI